MATKIRASNLHTDVKTMVTTMVGENALDSAEANLLIDSKFTAKNTDNLSEGSTNLYFTNARADARAQLKVDAIVGSAPGTLDTLQELGDALGDDPNFATTVTNSIATKLPLAGGTLTGNLSLTSTASGSSASPELELRRDITGADANYLGQIKFTADNDADQNIVFAKITGKILDASDGTEDGIIEFAHKKAGSNNISARFRSDSLQLINGTNLTVAGTTDLTGNLTVDTNTLYVDTSNNRVGIGTDSPSNKLDIKGTVGFEATNSTNKWLAYTYTDNTLRFNYNGAGADEVVIDSSGNLLVGKTTVGVANVGAEFRSGVSDYAVTGVSSSQPPALFGRNVNDGDIIRLRKDNAAVGSIGTANSGDLYIGNDDTTLLFAGGSDAIIPRGTAGAARDGAINLGLSAHRFKDLYLSGSVVNPSGDLTVDVSGDIILDAGGAQIRFYDDGTDIGVISNESNNLIIKSQVSNADLLFKGNDNGSTITALTLDMSEAGAATFNGAVLVGGASQINSSTLSVYGDQGISTTRTGSSSFIKMLVGSSGESRIDTANASRAMEIPSNGSEVVFNNAGVDRNFRVESDSNTHMIFVDAGSNEVGIGTSDPRSPLHVQTSHSSTDVTAANTNSTLSIGNNAVGNGIYNAIKFAANQQDMYIMSFNNGTQADRRMGFFLGSSAGDAVSDERLSIRGNGNVGIGTTSPLYKLSVDNGTNDGGIFRLYNEEVGLNVAIDGTTGSPNYTNASRTVVFNATRMDSGSSPKLRLGGQGGVEIAADANNVRMVVGSNGNVGIGTTGPTAKLHVEGTFQVRSSSSSIFNDTNNAENVRMLVSGTHFNADSVDKDFRVESNANAYALFVDGGADMVCFGTSNNTGLAVQNSETGVQITSSGRIFCSNADHHDFNRTSNGDIIRFRRDTTIVGKIASTTAGTTYSTTSDRRLKDNIEPISDATDKLMDMKPVTHTWIDNPDDPQVHGFIAQEMQEVVPEAVSGDAESDEMMSMDYGRITPVIVAALQDALNEIKELKTRIDELENK